MFIYEGKAKRLYKTELGYVMEFKDEVTAGDGARRDKAPGKGVLAAGTSALLFSHIESGGVATHFIKTWGPNSLLVKPAEPKPLEVIVRFKAYGSYLKRMPRLEPLTPFRRPIVEFHLKDDRLHDPLLLEEDVIEGGLATEGEVKDMRSMATAAAAMLKELYARANCDLLDIKLEFGTAGGSLVLIDEISGDTFRLICGGEHLDKEYYRKTGDARGLVERYRQLLEITKNVTQFRLPQPSRGVW
ncbi:MAG: phosphoribosylaminoimidazolesuccinocarboxamide synthase [Pyrobaculum sp.]